MCSLWNKSPMSPVHNGTTLWISWTRQNYRRLTQQWCIQFPRLQPPNQQPKSFKSQWGLQRTNNAIRIRTNLFSVHTNFIIPRKAGYCNHLRVSVCLFVCLFFSMISHKLLVGLWWNLVSREVTIIGRPSSKLGVIRIEIRIWDPDNCFSWTTGQILMKFGELGLYW